jgi:carbon starvation protein
LAVAWPMFGASNQLVAGLTLLVASAYLLQKGKRAMVTFLPAIAMFCITFFALGIEGYEFFRAGQYLLAVLSGLLVWLGLFILNEYRKKRKAYVS